MLVIHCVLWAGTRLSPTLARYLVSEETMAQMKLFAQSHTASKGQSGIHNSGIPTNTSR